MTLSVFSEEVPSWKDYFDLVSEDAYNFDIFCIGASGVRLELRFFLTIRLALLFDKAGFTVDGVLA